MDELTLEKTEGFNKLQQEIRLLYGILLTQLAAFSSHGIPNS